MTTKWEVPPGLWAGQTVAVLGNGPNMTVEVAESVRRYTCIVANRAIRFAPWADMFVCVDMPNPLLPAAHNLMAAAAWAAAADFKGLRVCANECDDINALCVRQMPEQTRIAPGRIDKVELVSINNNGLYAIRIAVMAGAAKILLLGFDPKLYDQINAHIGFFGFAAALQQIVAELRGKGIEIEFV